ncbi:MAG: hypothetical protein Q8L15_12120 [Methylobacter sp.]|nr:hypothetical protein [Methylobacter sp.]
MRDPNFSESQLQQAVNTAYIRKIFEVSGQWVFANVPSLFDEFDLGWDSAFHFPWLHYPPADNHEGCNFFLQYKLSGQLTSAGAKEWQFWNLEYFRFKIPHSTRNASGAFVDDFHQWERLKELANLNYPTFYATNSTLSKDDLKNESNASTLLNTIPMLDVRTVVNLHKHVTFTPHSPHFLMHSEKEEIMKTSFAEAIELLYELPTETLDESNKRLLHTLGEIGGKDENWIADFSKIRQLRDGPFPDRFRPWIMQSVLSSFIRKHVGANMLWVPKNG